MITFSPSIHNRCAVHQDRCRMNRLVEIFVALLGLVCLGLCVPQWGMDEYLAMPDDNIDSREHGYKQGTRTTTCACGWTNKARIVGGKKTLPNEYPLMAGMFVKKENDILCGGAIVTERHVVTAAHCTYAFKEDDLAVIVGEHGRHGKLRNMTGNMQFMPVQKIYVHEDWNPMSYVNDISIMFLKTNIRYNQFVGPACLPNKKMDLVNEYLKVLGWGYLASKTVRAEELMKVNLRVLPILTCANNYPRDIPVENSHQICTFNNNKDSCEGDSGGPLLWLDPETNRYMLAGLVSYGKRKCATHSPAVNTDVTYFADWVRRIVKESDPSVRTCSKQ
uniref:Venom S1 protease 14 n=1 Tax=Lethocerus distinctifemur TaxID=280095 RepID=A0A2K8JRC1_9HEMI|nr:venom S1 protease 14 [Lethocerus distinctifemur]